MARRSARRWTLVLALALVLGLASAIPLRKLSVLRAPSGSSQSAESSEESSSLAASRKGSSGSGSASSRSESSASSTSRSESSASGSSSSGSSSRSSSSGSRSSASLSRSGSSSESSEESSSQSDVPFSEQVANTLNGLTAILEKIHGEVESDERVFKAFKNKVLEDEISKAGGKVNWPAVKDLVKAEVAAGSKTIENQAANFKIDVLDVIQKGLDTLRSEVRTTMTSTYAAGRAMQAKWNAAKGSEESSSSASRSAQAAAALESVLASGPTVTRAIDSPDFDDDDLTKKIADKQASAALDSLVRSLDTIVIPQDREAIKRYIAMRLDNSRAVLQARKVAPADRGLSAADALSQLRKQLKDKLSAKDLNTELFDRLSTLTKQHLRKPNAESAAALRELRRALLASLHKMELEATLARATKPGEGESLEVSELDALQRRINALHARTEASHQSSLPYRSSTASQQQDEDDDLPTKGSSSSSSSVSSSSSSAAAAVSIPAVAGGNSNSNAAQSFSGIASRSTSSAGGVSSPVGNLQSAFGLTPEQARQLQLRLGENPREPELLDPKVTTQLPELVEKKKRQEFPMAPVAVDNDEIIFPPSSSEESSARSLVSTQAVKPITVNK